VERGPVSALFGRILVPLDGSAASETVLYQAERLICGRRSEVILFHAWNPDSPGFAAPEAAEDYLRVVQGRLSSGGAHVLRRIVRSGPVTQLLAETIESEKVSLVAMSSHGRTTSPRATIAGTVGGLLNESRVPIFVARAYQPSGSGEPTPAECEAPSIRRILVPLDGSSACEAVMPYARELGQLLGALIVILQVTAEDGHGPGRFLGTGIPGRPLGPAPGEEASPAERIEYAAKTFSAAGLETLTLNLEGEPISTILAFARPSAVDLIAMTTHGRTGLSKALMGSVAERVLSEAILPTLLVRSGAGSVQCIS